jgi:hypothetical protein
MVETPHHDTSNAEVVPGAARRPPRHAGQHCRRALTSVGTTHAQDPASWYGACRTRQDVHHGQSREFRRKTNLAAVNRVSFANSFRNRARKFTL